MSGNGADLLTPIGSATGKIANRRLVIDDDVDGLTNCHLFQMESGADECIRADFATEVEFGRRR